jgi:hypothetical protein
VSFVVRRLLQIRGLMKVFHLSPAAVAALVLGCAAGPSQQLPRPVRSGFECLPGEYVVVGRVVEEATGRPVRGVLVSIGRPDGESLRRNQRELVVAADSAGAYVIERVPDGYLRVRARPMGGYYTEERPLAIQGGQIRPMCPSEGCRREPCEPLIVNFFLRPGGLLIEA